MGSQLVRTNVAAVAALSIALCAPAGAQTATTVAAPAYTFSDGARAIAYDHCGDADLCATIDYPNGDRLAFYSEGAAADQPYVVHVVRTNAKGTVFEYSRPIDRSHHHQLTLDRGHVHLDVDDVADGTLRFRFSPNG